MNSSPLISIIIPIYNGEKYIDSIYNQLINQTYAHFECILVDDGSIDNSYQLLNSITSLDPRFKVLTQKNQGQGVARNKGIETALGDFITFMDVDDTISKELFSVFVMHASTVDAEIFSVEYAMNFDGNIFNCDTDFVKNKLLDYSYIQNVIINDLLLTEKFSAVWSKFYNKKFLLKNDIKFPNIKFYEEDLNFNLKAYNICNSAYIIDYVGYFYIYNQYGFSKNVMSDNFFKMVYEKYNYDYKNELNLKLDQKIIDECNTIRYIHKMIWLFFVYAREKKLSYKKTKDIILLNVLTDEFVLLIKKYLYHPKIKKGRVQYFILKNISSKNIFILKAMIFIFKIFYNEKFVFKIKKFL